jgi:hypothetical protein
VVEGAFSLDNGKKVFPLSHYGLSPVLLHRNIRPKRAGVWISSANGCCDAKSGHESGHFGQKSVREPT